MNKIYKHIERTIILHKEIDIIPTQWSIKNVRN